MKERITYVDIAKGIAISLMVLGHSGIPVGLRTWIYSFHMPFFFFVSGYTSNFTKDSFSHYAVRKIMVLGIPFLVYSAINLLLQPIAYGIPHLQYFSNWICNGWGGDLYGSFLYYG